MTKVCPKAQVEVKFSEVEFEGDKKQKQFDTRQELSDRCFSFKMYLLSPTVL